MAAAKCRLCQTKLTTSVAYKAEINKKAAYFCSEEHYQQLLKEEEKRLKEKEANKEAKTRQKEKEEQVKEHNKELRNKVYSLFAEVLNVGGITNTALYKEKAELNKVFSDEIIIAYLEENKEWIANAVSRLNGGEFGKIRYVSTILRNNLGDYKMKVVEKEKNKLRVVEDNIDTRVDVGLRINKKRKTIRRKGFAEMEG